MTSLASFTTFRTITVFLSITFIYPLMVPVLLVVGGLMFLVVKKGMTP
jgi:hypothetical protein